MARDMAAMALLLTVFGELTFYQFLSSVHTKSGTNQERERESAREEVGVMQSSGCNKAAMSNRFQRGVTTPIVNRTDGESRQRWRAEKEG